MGREWYWRGGSKSSKKGGGGGKGGGGANPPFGCMCAVFQFALHQQPSFKTPDAFLSEEQTNIPKGSETPRKSLELQEPSSLSPPTKKEEDEDLNIPASLSGIQIKTRVEASSSSEISSSPGIKTPNLVARLMGLDLLPDQSISSTLSSSPSIRGRSHNNLHQHLLGPRQQPLRSKTLSQISCSNLDNDHFSGGAWSLPETPRVSSARRSDVEHRLSLQINKENMSASEELVMSRISSLRRIAKEAVKSEDHQENSSPGRYARSIVKQVKESVSRRVGLVDISNTVRNNREPKTRFDDELVIRQFKSKKVSKLLTKAADDDQSNPNPGNIHVTSTSSCSPRLKSFEPKAKPVTNNVSEPQKPSLSTSPCSQVNVQLSQVNRTSTKLATWQEPERGGVRKCKKIVSEEKRFGGTPAKVKTKPPKTSDTIRNKLEETFVRPTMATRANIPTDKKCKKTPLWNDLLNNISVPTLLPLKKDLIPPATGIPQKQISNAQESKWSSQLSCCSSLQQSYKQQEATRLFGTRGSKNNKQEEEDRQPKNAATTSSAGITSSGDNNRAAAAVAAADEYHEYVSRILRRTGIHKDTSVSFIKWFSPSHPLDPSIFYHLEHYFTTTATNFTFTTSSQLGHRCNRKLLFHLVDEILLQALRPYINAKASSIMGPDIFVRHAQGSHLVELLCTKVRSFPGKDCQVLEDIDSLIDMDLPRSKVQALSEEAFGEEGEGIVTEVEKHILDSLIHETTTVLFFQM